MPSPTASTSAGGLVAVSPPLGAPEWRGLPVGPPGRGGRAPLIGPVVGQTLPRSQSWLCSKFTPTLTIVVVQLFAVFKLLAARLAHRRREEDHRETFRAWGQPTQKNTVGRAHADLHRDDSRFSGTEEPSIVARVPLAFPLDDPDHAQRQRLERHLPDAAHE